MAVKAPPGFQPDDAEQRRVNAPPAPARFRKEDLYRSVLEFQSVDDHAIQVSQVDHDNFTDLIWHLVYSTNFRTELEKVRVIFRWMTSKNMHTMTFQDAVRPGSPEEVLLSFKNKQGTYARSFEVLCRFAGLTSTILTGYAKGLDYRPGNHFKDSNYNHSWNAVLVDGSWYLIDSHWATRYLVSERNVAENLVYEYDDFFFLTNPGDLVYSHWSQAEEWQLLEKPVTLQEFEAMPLVKSYFFKCAMYFVSHKVGVIGTKNGRLALTLGYKKPTNFSYKIAFADSGDEDYQGQKLKNYALQHHGRSQTDTLVFRAPRAGEYYFSFFAQLLTGEVGVKSTFTAACEFKVVADTASPDPVPLPVCSDSTWGPGFAVEQLGLVANPPEGILTTTNGQVFLEFRKTKPAFVLCKLRRNGVDEEELEKYIQDNDLGEYVQVTFRLPSEGEYGIEVYGNDPSKDGDTYTHVCQYYVHFASPHEQAQAFYQDSPERRATMETFTFSVAAPGGYQPGSVGLESATAHMTMSDPDSLPPPPPELLSEQQYMAGTVPDTRQHQRYMPGSAPDSYQQQQYVASNVHDPNQSQFVTATVPDMRDQQQYTSATAPGTYQQQPYVSGSARVGDAQQQYSVGMVPDQRQQAVVSDVKFTPAGGQVSPGDKGATLQVKMAVPGSTDRKDVYVPADDQKNVIAPGAAPVVYTATPTQIGISSVEVGRGQVYAPGQKDSYAPGQVTYSPAAGQNVYTPEADQKTISAPSTAQAVWAPGGQKEVDAPAGGNKVWTPGSAQKDSDASENEQKKGKPPPTYKKPTWPPAAAQKDGEATSPTPWKTGVGHRPADAPSAYQRVTYTPDIIKKPSWTPSSVVKDADTPAQKNVWKPGSVQQDANAAGAEQKASQPPPVAKKPTWKPNMAQRDNDAAGQNVWRPGSAQKDTEIPSSDQKNVYAPVSVQKAVWSPGSAQKDADTSAAPQKKVWAPVSPQKNVWTPGTAQRDVDAPSVERKDIYAPGTERKDIYAPGTERKDIYAPGTERKDIYAPGTERKDIYAPGTERKDIYAPGTEQRDIYAPGTERKDIYAPGTERKDIYAPGTERKDIYAPGTERKDIYAPGTEQKDIYAPGTERKDIYAPGTERKDIYAPGTEQRNIYAPGTDRKDIYAPGSERKDIYVPDTERRDMYAPGTEQKSIHSPGQKNVWTPGSAQKDMDSSGPKAVYVSGSEYTPAAVLDSVGLPQQAAVTSVVIPPSTQPLQVQKRSVGQAPPSAPLEFQLVAVEQDRGEAPPPVPAPGPQQKPTLQAIDQQVLLSVDDHAVQVSKSDHHSFRDLVWDLIFSKNITNEIEKVRVIFCWLASKNLKEMNFNQVEKGSPEEVLMGLKTGVTTYAMLFDIMCSYAGLHSKIISGYAKGADYIPGMKFSPGQNQHTWNAVYIYGTWCLLDAHWGARRLVGKQTSSEDFHYQLDEYFFLTDPHQLIYTHLPDDPRWQLLDRCVSQEEFENMPHMKPQFFKFGLEFVTHRSAIIRSRGEAQVRLRYPANMVAVAFNFTIQFENGEEEYKGVKLNRYGMQDNDNGIATFCLRLPVSASYILFIYAKEDTSNKKENVYSQVCEYKIEYEVVPGSTPEPFPPCSSLTWGPSSAFYRYGLATPQKSPVILTQEGKAQLQIQHPRPMQFMGRLKHVNVSDSDLESCVMQRTVGNTTVFDISSPGRGEYGLEIFANDPATEGQTLYHNAQFLVVCQEDVRTTPLPKLPPGYLGPQPRFSDFGLTAVSHPDPVVHLDSNTVTVKLKSKEPMRILTNLIAVEGEEDFSNLTFCHTSESTTIILIGLPSTGFFKLQIYGTPVSDQSQQIPGIYNYLLNCQRVTEAVFPYPKQFAQWKEGCFMAEPMAIVNCQGPFASQVQRDRLPDTVTFCVDIPKAKAVAMVLGQDWTHLERGGGNRWSGQVKVGHCYGSNTRLTLNANYGADKTNYATLLEYIL